MPELYNATLFHLRSVVEMGQWPDTSAKRQLVMVTEDAAKPSDSTHPNTSGSFSVGYMPRSQPKANRLFPGLVKAAFALEVALMPDRPPSSTIAINRNAQFRPNVYN